MAGACYTGAVSVTLSEAESRRLVAQHGVAVSPFVTAESTAAVLAATAADEALSYPLAAKLCGRRIAHKTERGLVRLQINDERSLKAHCDDLLAAAEPDDGDVELLVTSMARGNRELIAGLHNDPQFGLVVMLGVGGVLARGVQGRDLPAGADHPYRRRRDDRRPVRPSPPPHVHAQAQFPVNCAPSIEPPGMSGIACR